MLIIITLTVAFCSVIYELLLSEMSSVLLGGTFYRYIVTIGIYIFCLGLGSLYFEKLKNEKREQTLFQIEMLLSLLGLAIPLLPLTLEAGTLNLEPGLQYQVISASIYALIITIGLLSGMELPVLMDMAETEKPGTGIRILAVDFLATFAGIVAFPLIFMRHIGLFHTSIIVACLNFAVFLYIARRLNPRPVITIAVTAVLLILLIAYNLFGIQTVVDKVF